MSKHQQPVPRPLKRAEYEVRFATREAEKGWTDLLATSRNAAVDAWDFLTKTPEDRSPRCHPLKGNLAEMTIQGVTLTRWQYEVTGGGRIWYAVGGSADKKTAGTVFLERVMPGHPNETVKQHR